jgi:hypothetical protein
MRRFRGQFDATDSAGLNSIFYARSIKEMMLSIQLLGLTLTIKMIIVSQLIEELDSLGIIVLHDKPSKYVDKWS